MWPLPGPRHTNLGQNLEIYPIGSPDPIRSILSATYQFVLAQIAASGDRLTPAVSRTISTTKLDAAQYFTIKTRWKKGQHLTWGMVGASVGWILDHLGEKAGYAVTVVFPISDSGYNNWWPYRFRQFSYWISEG